MKQKYRPVAVFRPKLPNDRRVPKFKDSVLIRALKQKMKFGKYQGLSIGYVLKKDFFYLHWLNNTGKGGVALEVVCHHYPTGLPKDDWE